MGGVVPPLPRQMAPSPDPALVCFAGLTRVVRAQRTTMGGILQKMLQAFYTKKLEVVLVGLENRYVLDPWAC